MRRSRSVSFLTNDPELSTPYKLDQLVPFSVREAHLVLGLADADALFGDLHLWTSVAVGAKSDSNLHVSSLRTKV
jgi:hypothetical protein